MKVYIRPLIIAVFAASIAACGQSAHGVLPQLVGPPPSAVVGPLSTQRVDVPSNVRQACPGPAAPGFARCIALVRTDSFAPNVAGMTVAGYGPADLQSAYALPSSVAGAGQTVAIVDAYDDGHAEADLSVYRTYYGLPPCTTANLCFRKLNQGGNAGPYPAGNAGWAQEISLDLDMVSAICPNCHIMLVEATNASFTDLAASVDTAVRLGATEVSNSYGAGEFSGETTMQSHYDHPRAMITASSGDAGFGAQFPAASRFVTAVGGTSLWRDGSARGWSETAWSGAGSGCSRFVGKPAWQHDTGCPRRTIADVSAVADPNTGVAVYDKGWMVFGGTSVASPIIASVYALAGNPTSSTFGQDSYLHVGSLFDVTTGSNGVCVHTYLCTAGTGFDGPTGNGTPNGITAF